MAKLTYQTALPPSLPTFGLEFREIFLRGAVGSLMPGEPAWTNRSNKPLASDPINFGLVAEELRRKRDARNAREAGAEDNTVAGPEEVASFGISRR